MAGFFRELGRIAEGIFRYTSPVGYAIHGQEQARKGQREAQRIHGEQMSAMQRQENEVRAARQKTESELATTRERIARSQAQANRARVRGGLFGENEQQKDSTGLLNPRLG